jgi:hypothetical protein
LIGKIGGMSTQNNIFIITSTIITQSGLISPYDRFLQTIETIDSIRKKLKNSIIILVDNSNLTFIGNESEKLISKVDYFFNISERKICQFMNKKEIKGAGESYMLLVALNFIKQTNLASKRIFKISGRYKLSDEFDINLYENLLGKFCFKKIDKNEYGKYFLHSRMWSFCNTLLDETIELVKNSFITHTKEDITIEEAIYKNIDLKKTVEFERIYCEGYIAPWNKLIRD